MKEIKWAKVFQGVAKPGQASLVWINSKIQTFEKKNVVSEDTAGLGDWKVIARYESGRPSPWNELLEVTALYKL
jgi:hypothetical protein